MQERRSTLKRQERSQEEKAADRRRSRNHRIARDYLYSKEFPEVAAIDGKICKGELTIAEAKVEAERCGFVFDAISDVTFDPMVASDWTPAQCATWIAKKSVDEVRLVSIEARRRTVTFVDRKTGGRRVVHAGYAIDGHELQRVRPSPPAEELSLYWHVDLHDLSANETISSAVVELRARLRDGALTATGIHRRDGERRKIEPSEWIDLQLKRDDIAHGSGGSYFVVRICRADVMALWPAVEASPSPMSDAELDNECLSATNSDGGKKRVPTGDRLREQLEKTFGPIDGVTQKVAVKFIREQYGIGREAARDKAKTALGERKPGPIGKKIAPNNCAE